MRRRLASLTHAISIPAISIPVISILILLGAVFLSAGRPRDNRDFVLRSDVRLVQLDVAVKDKKANPVGGLEKQDFSVYENGKPQTITVFAHEDTPVSMGILVDESYSMRPNRTAVLVASEAFIAAGNPHDEMFVLNFNDTVAPGLPAPLLFTDDRTLLGSALRHGFPEGKTALYDAIADGLDRLKQAKNRRRMLVLISDGGDNTSHHTKKEILDLAEDEAVTIHTIGLYEENDPERNTGFLRDIAGITGGEAIFPANSGELMAACNRIARDIRSRYTVGYVPQQENGPLLRRIQVQVKSPTSGKLIALTRKSFTYDHAHADKSAR